MRSYRQPLRRALLIAAWVFVIDLISKQLVNWCIAPPGRDPFNYPFQPLPVFHLSGISFVITHAINQGAAWGMFSSYPQALLIVRLLMIAILTIYLVFFNTKKEMNYPLALIIAGAIGNVFDTMWYGHVIDMFQFFFWGWEYPVFNIADSAITIGTIWLALISLKKPTAIS